MKFKLQEPNEQLNENKNSLNEAAIKREKMEKELAEFLLMKLPNGEITKEVLADWE